MSTTLLPPAFCEPLPEPVRQRMGALAKAQRIRIARAALMRRMEELSPRESCSMAADLVADTPEVMCSLEVGSFLHRVRRVGVQTAEGLLRSAGVPWTAKLGELTPRQRHAFEATLRYRAEFYMGHNKAAA